MKKLFVLMALFLVAVPFIAAQECDTVRDLVSDNLNTRYLFYYYRAEIRAVSMDTVIGLYQENGIDTSGLEQTRDDFKALYDKAKEKADDGDAMGFNDVVRDGIDLIADFRTEARKESVTGVLPAIKDALDSNRDYLDGLKRDAIDSKIATYLKVFDARVCQHQKIIDRWSEKVDVSELQDDLDAISDKKTDLEAKIEAADDSCETAFELCTTTEADALRELHREINDDFRNLNIKFRDFFVKGVVQAGIDLQKANINLHKTIADNLEKRGKDVAEVKADLDDAESLNSDSQDALDNDDVDGAKEKFNEAKEKMDEVRQGIKEARSQ